MMTARVIPAVLPIHGPQLKPRILFGRCIVVTIKITVIKPSEVKQ